MGGWECDRLPSSALEGGSQRCVPPRRPRATAPLSKRPAPPSPARPPPPAPSPWREKSAELGTVSETSTKAKRSRGTT